MPMAWGRMEGERDSWSSWHWGRRRKRFLWLSGPPQVSASTQRDGGAKRHQFTNKGPTSPTTKKTYVIELTPELQLTLRCQPPLISFVNPLCCLPNWGPVTCGLYVYKGKRLDSLPKQTLPFSFRHTRGASFMYTLLNKEHSPESPNTFLQTILPNYKQMYWQSIDILILEHKRLREA